MTTLADAFVKLRPDTTGFGPEMTRKTEVDADAAGKNAGKKFGAGMLASVGSVFAAGALVNFFKGAFDEAQEAQKTGKLTEAVIKSTGGAAKITAGQVGELATSLSNMSGIDDELIQHGENVLLTFTKVRNEAGKGNDIFDQGTRAALDLSVALGTDLQSANILVGKALNDPLKGLTALGKAGIQFTEAQKKQIKTMVEAGDTLGAQKIILGELRTQFDGAAAAAATPADKAKVAWGNFQEMVGTKLMPKLNELLQWGLKNQSWLVPLVGVLAALGIVVGIVSVATSVWSAAQSVAAVATGIWSAVQWVLNLAFLAFPLTWIIVGIVALIAIIVLIATKTTWFQDLWKVVWTFVKDVAQAVGQWFAGPFAGFFVGAWNKIVDAGQAVWRFITVTLPNGFRAAAGWVASTMGNIKDAIVNRFNDAVSYAAGIPGRIIGFFAGIGARFQDIGRSIVQGIANGIEALKGWLEDKAKNLAQSVWNAAKHAIGFGSPATKFIPLGESIPQGMGVGVDQAADDLSVKLHDLFPPPTPPAASAQSGRMDRVERLLNDLIDAVERVAPGVGREVNGAAVSLRRISRAGAS